LDYTRDTDPVETKEWLDSLDGVIEVEGPERAHYLLHRVMDGARRKGAQAKQAVGQYIREASRLYGAMESSMEAAQSGTREINRKAIGFAEKNVNAAFDFAQQLVRAKDPKEIVQLQQEFLKRQVEQMSGQMKELGEQATQTAQTASAAVRPKS
jgi:phasin